jgi:hypothetical protein
MHRRIAALAGGLALAFTFAIPAAANVAAVRASHPAASARPADANNCGGIFNEGNGEGPYMAGGGVTKFCNVSIPINGEFEIVASGTSECLALDSTAQDIDLDSAAACTSSGGKGDTWDRWTAIQEVPANENGGTAIWEFQNQFNGENQCLYDDTQDPAIYATCNNSDHFEWWTWPGSNL